MTLRVRFAPSPTGHLHVGNARTALFNWLLARGSRRCRSCSGSKTPTPNDRPSSRSSQSSRTCAGWGSTGTKGRTPVAPYGPYRQSERLDLYRATAASTSSSAASRTYCFCSPEQLEAERQAALAAGLPPKYSGTLPGARSGRRGAPGRGRRAGGDSVRGAGQPRRDVPRSRARRRDVQHRRHRRSGHRPIGRPAGLQLRRRDRRRPDGDHARDSRRGSHLEHAAAGAALRGARSARRRRSRTSRSCSGPDHAPLSKRHGATSVAEFRERGYLPEALVNYLALLGWSPGDGQELVPIAEMAAPLRPVEGRPQRGGVRHRQAGVDEPALHEGRAGRRGSRARRCKYFVRAGYVTHATDVSLGYLESLLPMAVGSVDRLEEIPGARGVHLRLGRRAGGGAGRAPSRTARARSARLPTRLPTLGPLDRERVSRGRDAGAREDRRSRAGRCFIRFASR